MQMLLNCMKFWYRKRYDQSQPVRLFLGERINGGMDELLSYCNYQGCCILFQKIFFTFSTFKLSSTVYGHLTLTYWWIFPVQFLLLREEVQTVLQRYLHPRAPLGNGQGQIAEHIKSVGVVWAHWAVQRAPQLSREQVCGRKMNRAVRRWNQLMEPSEGPFLTYYSAVISLQVLFPHDSCLLGNPMGRNDNLTENESLIYHTKWKIRLGFT